jgi:aspartate aminotransferase
MPTAVAVQNALAGSSMIRKMFEEGLALKKQYGPDKVFDFSLGNPDVAPPEVFGQVLRSLASSPDEGVHGYMPNAGFPETREAVAEKVRREHGVRIDGSHVVMACGAAGALNVVLKTILNPGDEVIVSSPYFMEYRAYTENHGGRLVEVPAAADFTLDTEAIAAELRPKTAAVLINSPNNPTGRLYSAETLAALARVLRAHGERTGRPPYLVADEPYRELVYGGAAAAPVLCAYPHAIVVNSFSKSLSLPGERIGYIAVGPDIDDKKNLLAGFIYATRTLGFVNAPALMQRCIARLVHERVPLEVYARRREAFMQVLGGAGIAFSPPDGAFYLFARVPSSAGVGDAGHGEPGNDVAFCEHLKKYRILSVNGSSFHAPGWARFAYCVSETTIRASAAAFKEAVASFCPP